MKRELKREVKTFIRGVGVGFIVAATLFYLAYFAVRHSETMFADDTIVIERAEELGMVFPEEPME